MSTRRTTRDFAVPVALAIGFGVVFMQMLGPGGLVLGVALGIAIGEGERRRRDQREDVE